MTRLASAKRVRFILLICFFIGSGFFIISTNHEERPNENAQQTAIENDQTEVFDFKHSQNHPLKLKTPSTVDNHEKLSENGADDDFVTWRIKQRLKKAKENAEKIPTKDINMGFDPKKFAGDFEENEDQDLAALKNPHNFLGDIGELDNEQLEAIKHIYEAYQEDASSSFHEVTPEVDLLIVPTMDFKSFPEFDDKPHSTSINNLKFRIYSHNVKNGGHTELVPGEKGWVDRYKKIAASIDFNSPHDTIVTLQEVYKFQLDDILHELNRYSRSEEPEWTAYGVGRINGDNVGEFVPILYRPSEWELVFNDSIWLNHRDPKKAYNGWDAKYLRICSYVTLKHKSTGNYVNVFNTHFDHIGLQSQIGSVNLLKSKIEEINEWPSFMCGDLNMEPSSSTYKLLSESFKDMSTLTTPFNRYGHLKSTVTGFQGEVILQGGLNIDYIFGPPYSQKISDTSECPKVKTKLPHDALSVKLRSWGMLHSKYDGQYISDHRPIVADILIEKKC